MTLDPPSAHRLEIVHSRNVLNLDDWRARLRSSHGRDLQDTRAAWQLARYDAILQRRRGLSDPAFQTPPGLLRAMAG